MKDILKDTLVVIMTAIVSAIGFVSLIIAFQSKPNTLVFIPSFIVSWIILYPTYKYWVNFFKSLFKFKNNVKED